MVAPKKARQPRKSPTKPGQKKATAPKVVAKKKPSKSATKKAPGKKVAPGKSPPSKKTVPKSTATIAKKSVVNLVNQGQLAEHLDLTTRRIRALNSENVFDSCVSGSGRAIKYDLDRARMTYIRWLRASATGATMSPEKISYQVEKSRLTKYQADEKQLTVEKMRAELVSSDQVEMVLTAIFSELKNHFSILPIKIKSRLPNISARDAQWIQKLVADACNSASSDVIPSILNQSD